MDIHFLLISFIKILCIYIPLVIFVIYPLILIQYLRDATNYVTEGDSSKFKGFWKLFRSLIFNTSTLKCFLYEAENVKVCNKILTTIRKEVSVVKFVNSTDMNNFVLDCLQENDSVLVVSNGQQMGKALTHNFKVRGARKQIKLIYASINTVKESIAGIDYDYIIWMDVTKQDYILYKKENGRNVIKEFI